MTAMAGTSSTTVSHTASLTGTTATTTSVASPQSATTATSSTRTTTSTQATYATDLPDAAAVVGSSVTDIMVVVLVGVGAALAGAVVALVARLWPQFSPLERRIKEFSNIMEDLRQQDPDRFKTCEKGPGRALRIGRVHDLLEFFSAFIRDRTAYYLDGNIIRPLTKEKNVSLAEFVGAERVEWFVSHFWGTAFEHFCSAVRKHAESVCGDARSWKDVRYWICFCSNNQHHLQDELGESWRESSFYITLRSGACRGTCMVLDDKVLPLTRSWCIFELLQTVRLKQEDSNFMGLFLCTSGGVLNTGSGSVEVAMALAEKVATMDLEQAQASRQEDRQMINSQVIKELNSFAALNRFIRHAVRAILQTARILTNQHFDAVFSHLADEGEEN
eukprot:CAMPEP_0179055716 /NCGR_PEP_ID=MMETSP0796-20121207/23444_1 /TAXON_ID=73915 /ORGANISM="Pyrodinium bahamense, Strain pbaha01" /LENGTH=388 /DNA_ID=CAMNT_0020752377 /DNA_START=72 /DNA_END=1238 /DNA_ORIENTATION=-